MNTLYEFTVYRREKVKVEDVSKDKDGNEVKVTKEVEEGVPYVFVIKKPTRSMFDEAELFFGVKLAEGVKAGMLTHKMLAKRYMNDGGLKSEVEEEAEKIIYTDIFNRQLELQELESKKDRTKEEQEKLELIKKEIAFAAKQASKMEAQQSSLFDQTAESRAKNKTICWWAMHLAYKKICSENGEEISYEPFFGPGSYDEKMDRYDQIEESDNAEFDQAIAKRFLYLISFWYVGKALGNDDFSDLEKSLIEQAKEDEEIREFISELKMIDDKTPDPEKKSE